MIARKLAPQSQWVSGYAQFLQLSDEDFLDLDQVKGTDSTNLTALQQLQHIQQLQNDGGQCQGPNQDAPFQQCQQEQHNNDYYELTPLQQNSCFHSMFLGGVGTTTTAPTTACQQQAQPQGGQQADGAGVVGGADGSLPSSASASTTLHNEVARSATRKRRNSYQDASDCDDDTEDSKSCRTDGKKQNHSEIEKRRRDKMNTYITELSAMVPMCHAMSRKLDKLTVLRMAVQHLRTIRGAVHSYAEGKYKPAFLSDQDLKQLILQTAEGFLFVVGCDRGRILFVSESVSQILNFSQDDLLGQSWFDILHPKDVAKVKEQLSSSDLSPRERLIDAKTMLPVKADMPSGGSRLCPGARRSFFCRMKRKAPPPSPSPPPVKEESGPATPAAPSSAPAPPASPASGGAPPPTPTSSSASSSQANSAAAPSGQPSTAAPSARVQRKTQNDNDRKYSVVHCTGYLKSWAPEKVGVSDTSELSEVDADADADSEACNLLCLVAVGRLQPVQAPASVAPSTPQPPALQSHAMTAPSCNAMEPVRHVMRPGRRLPPLRPAQFTSKHAVDGKFLFVDQRATPVLGFLPQELLGTSMYEYYHPEDVEHLAVSHKAALATTDRVKTKVYWFRSKDSSYVCLQSEWRAFKNPWTKDVEYLISKNTVVRADSTGHHDVSNAPQDRPCQDGYNFFSQGNQRAMQNAISSHVEASKIGRQVADEALDRPRNFQTDCDRASASPSITGASTTASPTLVDVKAQNLMSSVEHKPQINSLAGSLLPPPPPRSSSAAASAATPSATSATNSAAGLRTASPQRDVHVTAQRPEQSPLSGPAATPPSPALSRTSEAGSYGNGTIRNNVTLSSLAGSEPGLGNEDEVAEMMGSVLAGSPSQTTPVDCNDDAAMEVIMSLLEADSELGERVDFSGLSWPLP